MYEYGQGLKQMGQVVRDQIEGLTRRDWLKVSVMASCVMIALGTVFVGAYVIFITRDLPSLPQIPLTQTTGIEVYDRHESLIGVIGQRVIRAYDDIPETFLQALLVTEDRDFFDHPGISIRGVIRAALTNLRYTGPYAPGGQYDYDANRPDAYR